MMNKVVSTIMSTKLTTKPSKKQQIDFIALSKKTTLKYEDCKSTTLNIYCYCPELCARPKGRKPAIPSREELRRDYQKSRVNPEINLDTCSLVYFGPTEYLSAILMGKREYWALPHFPTKRRLQHRN